MAQPGSVSIIFANIFSASSYSKECSSATARLKSFEDFKEQLFSKLTEPKFLSGGPQETSSPLFRFKALISSTATVLSFVLQLPTRKKIKNKICSILR